MTKNKINAKGLFFKFFDEYRCIFIFLVIFIALSLTSDVFMTQANLTNVLRQNAASAILGVGFTLVVAAGHIDLSVGTMIGMIGVLTAILSKIEGVPMLLVILVALVIGVAAGALNAFFITTFKLPAFIVTLANMSLFEGICYIACNTTPVSGIPDWYKYLGQGYVGPIPIPVIIMVVVAIIGHIVVAKTVFGRSALSIGGNSEAARVCGINIKQVTYGVFMFIGFCAAVASLVITGRSASAQTSAGQGMELDAIAAVVIGGTPLSGGSGKIAGTVVGCMIVGCINNGLNLLNVNSNWQLVAKGILILSAIILDAQSAVWRANMLKKTSN